MEIYDGNNQRNNSFNTPRIFKENTKGIIGFGLSIVSIFLIMVPFLGWIVCILGIIFSGIGLKKRPKGWAIAGLIISIVILIGSFAIYFFLATSVSHNTPASFTPLSP